jgi:hypothetical protein
MRIKGRSVRTWLALFAASILTIAACGARTGLGVDERRAEPVDAGHDASVADCKEAGITYIYLISSENELLRFYPPDLSLTSIGTLKCPSTSYPFSMAVNRQGIAYVLFESGELFRVSTLTASCKATGFLPKQGDFPLKFGMAFSSNKADSGEALFVSGLDLTNPGAKNLLGRIDTATFGLSVIAPSSEAIDNPELTGTSDSRLFGFGRGVPDSHLAEIDKATAEIKSDVLVNLNQSIIVSWAFAFWGGDFYFFTSEEPGSSVVHRCTPGGSKKPPQVLQIDNLTIVGAGVSTCAPSE